MKEIVFVDNPGDAAALAGGARETRHLVSMTAAASEAFDRRSIRYDPVGRFADLRPLSAADDQFNRDVFAMAASLERAVYDHDPSLATEGPGFVTGHAYCIQYSVSAIAKRACLMRGAIDALRPTSISIFDTPVTDWFSGDPYRINPWIQITTQLAAEHGLTLNVLPAAAADSSRHPLLSELIRHPYPSLVRGLRMIARKIRRYGSSSAADRRVPVHGRGRLLFGDGFNDYFGPVIDLLVEEGMDCFAITPRSWANTSWGYYYPPIVSSHDRRTLQSAIGVPHVDGNGDARIRTFDDWLARQDPLKVLDFDVLPTLAPQLRHMIDAGPALARHADLIATWLLDDIRPHAVIFSAITSLPQRRLAHHAIRRGIPVAAYQHAFGYEAQRHASGEQIETLAADYFLTFGPGVQPRPNAVFPARARYVSVGSARIESMRSRFLGRKSVSRGMKQILWVGEFSNGNSLVTTMREDTTRYEIQKECLEVLSTMNGTRVVFRPYRTSERSDGTVIWLERRRFRNVTVDTLRSFEELAIDSDLVIIDATSPTTWGEAVALERPVILFCDPIQARVDPVFGEDLDQVVEWCHTPTAFTQAIRRIAGDPATIRRHDPAGLDRFLHRYVLGGHNGACARSAASFIGNLVAQPQNRDLEQPA